LKEYTSEPIRNIALVGHVGSGKTIFTDAVLLNSGAVTRIGRVEDGSTVSDYHGDEIERQISINATLASTEFRDIKFNLLDTPGYTDFAGEVISSLRVADVCALFLKSVEGVEVGSELVWKYAERQGLPSVILVNKMDNEHADFDAVVELARNRFGHGVTPVQFPVKHGPGFRQIVDILLMKMLVFKNDGSGSYEAQDIPAELADRAASEREALVEKIAESSEDLMNSFFEEGTLSDADLRNGIHASLLKRELFPVFCMSAVQNIGVVRIMEFLKDFGPNPAEFGPAKGKKPESEDEVEIRITPDGEPVAFIFKTLSEQHVGELSLFRVYRGKITPGLDIMNHSSGKVERINQIYAMRGKDRKEVTTVPAGDIGAVVKLKDTHTCNTLASKATPVILPPIIFPDPLTSGAIKPRAKGDEDKISNGLHTLHEEDPSFMLKVDTETHETIILGQGEIHLDVMLKRLKQRFGVEVDIKPPRIPYRETIRKAADVSYKHKKQTGGAGQYGEVYLKIEPKPRGEGYEFVDAIVGGVISNKFIPAVDKGIQEQMVKGVVAGYQLVDVKVTLYDGSQHTVDSNEISFKVAAQQAFKKGILDANPVMLEPIYNIEVTVPDEFMGDVMGDISSHRGKIQGMESEGPFQVIRAKVPLAELHQYATRLRSITQGRGIFRRSFSHYEDVPHEVMNKIIEEAAAQKEEDA